MPTTPRLTNPPPRQVLKEHYPSSRVLHFRRRCGQWPNGSGPFDTVRPLPWFCAGHFVSQPFSSTYIPWLFDQPSRPSSRIRSLPHCDDTPRSLSHSICSGHQVLRTEKWRCCLCLSLFEKRPYAPPSTRFGHSHLAQPCWMSSFETTWRLGIR